MDLIPVALPPLPEQHRIVAKVDELMALCDRLEATQREQETRREQLTASAHHHLNNGGDAEELRTHSQFFIGHLPRFTTRPDQIKQLRQTILDLAVRGKLVHLIEEEETASILIRKIEDEQKRLINRRVIKRRTYNDSNLSEEAVIDIPKTWQFTALGKLLVFGPQNGISPTASSRPDAPRSITLTATTSGIFKSDYYKQIEANVPLNSEFWLRDGDLLFQRGNTREYVGIAACYDGKPGEFLYPDLIIKVRLSESVNLRYVHICCVAPYARDYFGRHASGAQATMPKINHDILINLPIPIPPLAEQRRIVAKVDELMGLCNQLEASLSTAQTESNRLLESVLHHALEASA
jgi:type I restriction enzyme S subunit